MFCLDTSALLDAGTRWYPLDLFPSLWTKLSKAAEDGVIVSPDEVLREISKKDDGDDPVYTGLAGLKRVDDAANQLGCLAGARRGFNDKALVERRTDSLSSEFVLSHGVSRNSFKTARRSGALRRIRDSSYGPQISL